MEKTTKIRLRRPAILSMPEQDAEKLIAAGSGDAALVYIYILKNGGELELSRAAFDLRRTEKDLRAALARLEEMGILCAETPAQKPLPAQELPEVRAEDVARRTAESPDFKALVEETQKLYGRLLSTSELKTLFNLYDYLALPPEVILLLINHCAEETARRYGPGKKPSFRALEKEAYSWVNREIITYERAEEWLTLLHKRSSQVGEALSALGIRDRSPTDSERRYINAWLDLGFDTEALAEAYDRTVTNTGGLKWRYMDGILHSWDAKGLHTLEEIQNGDKKPARTASGQSAAGPDRQAIEQMKKLREKVRNS